MTDSGAKPGFIGAEGLSPGTILQGKYRIERRLGAGGMGLVYEATHLDLRKRVAVKMLAPAYSDRDDLMARVVREARAASATGHPNVVMVTDLGWEGNAPFFVMELIQGHTVEELIGRTGSMPLPKAATILCQVLDGLQAVHDVGITHRDLKPSNVMLIADKRRGTVVKLLDFGISKLSESTLEGDDQSLTRPGAVMGTPRHMAPEQVRGEDDVDHRADVHAAGTLLYTMLVGRSPFSSINSMATMARVLEGRYDPASDYVADLPQDIDRIIGKAMAVERADRFADAHAMREALLPYARGQPNVVTEFDVAGPPIIDEFAPLDASNLPPLAGVGGTELARGTSGQWPSARGSHGSVVPGTVLPVGDPRLEIDVPKGWRPGDRDGPADGKMPRRRVAIPWGVLMVVALLAGGAWVAWNYRGDIEHKAKEVGKTVGSKGTPGEVVLLMVDAKPKDAIVFVDDVQHSERPISIPKTGEYVKLRIEAKGYKPRVMQIEAKQSRRLQVELDRDR